MAYASPLSVDDFEFDGDREECAGFQEAVTALFEAVGANREAYDKRIEDANAAMDSKKEAPIEEQNGAYVTWTNARESANTEFCNDNKVPVETFMKAWGTE